MGRVFEAESDLDQARNWFEKAARQGHSEAQRILGVFHQDGIRNNFV